MPQPSSSRESQRAEAIAFGPTHSRLFGWYHAARADSWRSCAVVLCNPLGYEAICAHRTYRVLAERLADAGFAALRFDYAGTGDSAGDDRDGGRVEAWLDSVRRALDEANARSGASRTSIFGLRLGATLAAVAAASRGGVDSAALWAACASGTAYLRETRVVRRAGERARASSPALDARMGEESAGFLLTDETIAALPSLDLARLTRAPAANTLVLSRGILASDDKLATTLDALGTRTTRLALDGYSTMMLDPHVSVVPGAIVDAVVSWLSEQHPVTTRGEGIARGRAVRPPIDAGTSRASSAVLESPASFGERRRLFGIVTETPRGDGDERARAAVILVSVGAMHRIGPSRSYVLLARRLLSLGFTSLRFDLSGIGDSAASEDGENVVYASGAANDVREAMDWLQRERGIDRFVLVGLCSGAYAAYCAARADNRAVALVAVNLPTFEWRQGDPIGAATPKTIKSTSFYQDAMKSRETWHRLVRGQVRVAPIARGLVERARMLLVARAARARSLLAGESDTRAPVDVFRRLRARGVRSLLLYSHDDPGIDQARIHLGRRARELGESSSLRIAVADCSDHTFASGPAQERLLEIVTDFLRECEP